jgi:hypothetical protein
MRMGSATAAILTVAILAVWHFRTRRHPGWWISPAGRFYITTGYPAVAIAVYWLSHVTDDHGREWVFGNLWALAAMVMFVLGFNSLRDACDLQGRVSREIESISANGQRQRHATEQRTSN